jgi:holliday junction DNA helicase RuvA
MIDFVKGTVAYHETDSVAVEASGVGYRVFVANPFAWEEGREVLLFTHHVVKEDAQLLYGFGSRRERDLFRVLLEVSGVGPKAAMGMLSALPPDRLVRAIELEDLKTLTRLPGIGKKTAQRLVLELKDRLKKAGFTGAVIQGSEPARTAEQPASSSLRDVIAALQGLGYNEEEAGWAAGEALAASGRDELPVDEWIRRALQVSMKR